MPAKDTYAQRDFTNGDTQIKKGEDLSALPQNQLDDFRLVGLIGTKAAADTSDDADIGASA